MHEFWERIRDDQQLERARRKLSLHEIVTIAKHARAASDVGVALRAILADPHGCRFCDYGKLRTPDDPSKAHDSTCGYLLAELALAETEVSRETEEAA
jgi:hypothetical protein